MTATPNAAIDRLAIDTIRFLAVDMVEKADSGHPGTPMAQAPLAYLLWTKYLRHNPANPDWLGRDRFVLSCGHASALLYALLHLAGYPEMTMDEIKSFRQWGSITPGHPEYGHTPGVETTTGPLGQGVGNAVGMAIAERFLAARFNRPGREIFDWRVFAIASDGDVMEGVASEASSLAGHLGLANLTLFWDDNRITIDGSTSLAFSEDVGKRYEAYGWHVQRVEDANDLESFTVAIDAALAETERPSLISFRSHIGYGSPKQDTAEAHGSPLGEDAIEAAREKLGWDHDEPFVVPDEAREAFEPIRERGERLEREWNELFDAWASDHPEAAEELRRARERELPEGWEGALPSFSPDDGPMATRGASGKVLNALAGELPLLVGGSADLAGSNKTEIDDGGSFSKEDRSGRNLHFGVREHGMGAILNGMAVTGMTIPFGSTFLIFSDYMRPSIRLAALMEVPVLYVFTHDSIYLGEDGPTHQPVSQLLSLRAIPQLTVIRPADAKETVEAWRLAIADRDLPTALVLTRQKLPVLEADAERVRHGVARGAYVLADPEGGTTPELVLMASGSEVSVCLETHALLAERGIATRVVSMPSWELFEAQPESYRDEVLLPDVPKRLAVEVLSPLGWHRFVGPEGEVMGLERYGASAPWKDLQRELGFRPEDVAARVERMLGR